MGSVEDSTPLLPDHVPTTGGRGKQWADAHSDVLKRIQAAAANPTHKTYLWVGIGAGLCCGIVAYVYSTAFQSLLNLVWVRTWLPSACCDLQKAFACRATRCAPRSASHYAQVRIPEHLVLPALHKLQKSRGYDPDSIAWVYTVAMSTLMGTLAGVVQSIMGSPGDLPETIAAIHEKARLRLHFECNERPLATLPRLRNHNIPCIEVASFEE